MDTATEKPVYMVSTIDNPFNPWTHWDEWYAWDETHGYKTTALLGRVVRTSDELADADAEAAIDMAVEEIVRENVTGMYIKVAAPSEIDESEE